MNTNQSYLETLLSLRRMPHSAGDPDGLVDGMRLNRLFGLNDLIIENLNKNSVVCELGSHVGISSSLFAYYCKIVFCVDPWEKIGVDYIPEFENEFDINVRYFGNVIKIKEFSNNALIYFADHSLDCVYIDADHEYPSVKQDILNWTPKIKSGGIIAGHDYIPATGDIYVKKAVDEIFGKPDKLYEDSSWIKRI